MPLYNHDDATLNTTKRCIQALLDHQDERFHTRLTVVDDGSPLTLDGSPVFQSIAHTHNRGIAVGWNSGWRANPKSDFYCWINSDCEVTPGWAFPLIAAVEQLHCIAMPYTNGEKSDGIGITGWCFLTSREIAETIGPFDETFVPAQYEDTDWFHRAIYQHRIPLVNVPISNVLHVRQQGGTKALQRFHYLHMANRFRYAWKHGVDPALSPPFWNQPLPDVDVEDAREAL
jgi:GT2 family glycosyltransferase